MSRITVYYDLNGKIASIIALPAEAEGAPPANILPVEGCESIDIDLDDEQRGLPLIALHTRYRLDVRGRRLIGAEEDRQRPEKAT
jgi:hypothetical protein